MRVELYLHASIRLYGVVLVRHKGRFQFCHAKENVTSCVKGEKVQGY